MNRSGLHHRPGQAGAFALGAAAVTAYILVIRPWYLRWGATDAECHEALPGDEFTPSPNGSSNHAITIDAPPSKVWPWIAQIGQDKGGFYSYTWLENLVGCRMVNAERILPDCQQIAVGDSVRLHPKAPPLPVLLVQDERALVMGSNSEAPGTWGFYLSPTESGGTRLIVRGRTHNGPGLVPWLGHHVLFEPAHFIMERKMLLGIKARAESSARTAGTH